MPFIFHVQRYHMSLGMGKICYSCFRASLYQRVLSRVAKFLCFVIYIGVGALLLLYIAE